MSGISTRKFPVKGPYGDDFLVKLREYTSPHRGYGIEVTLLVKRRWFGFRGVFRHSYYNGGEFTTGTPLNW